MNFIRNHIEAYVQSRLVNKHDFNFDVTEPTENDKLLIESAPGGWSIDNRVVEFLISLLTSYDIQNVVEIGAGYSSIIIHHYLSKKLIDYSVFSMEENSEWFHIPSSIERIVSADQVIFEVGPIKFVFGSLGIYAKYDIPNKAKIDDGIDLLIVDGPPYYFGREGGLDDIYKKLKVGCVIVLDDAERYTEKCVIYKWLKTYSGLELSYLENKFGDKGLAILTVNSKLKKRFSLKAFMLGFYQGCRRLLNYRKILQKQTKISQQ